MIGCSDLWQLANSTIHSQPYLFAVHFYLMEQWNERLVVSYDHKNPTIELTLKLLWSRDYWKVIFIKLRLIIFSCVKSSQRKHNGSIRAIRHPVWEDCSSITWGCTAGSNDFFVSVIADRHSTRLHVFPQRSSVALTPFPFYILSQ